MRAKRRPPNWQGNSNKKRQGRRRPLMAQPTPSADDRFFALPTRPRSGLQATSALAGLVTAKKRSISMNALQPTTTPIPYRSSGGGRYALLFIHGFMDA